MPSPIRLALAGPIPTTDGRRGGTATVVSSLANSMLDLKSVATVDVVTLVRQKETPFLHSAPRLKIYPIKSPALPRMVTAFTADFVSLRRTLNNLNPDVVHAHGQDAYALAAVNCRLPVVLTVHGILDRESRLHRNAAKRVFVAPLQRLIERRSLALAKHVIVIAPYVAKSIRPWTNAHLYSIDNPVDERFFALKRQPHSGFRLLFVGTMTSRKGVLFLLEAFKSAVHASSLISEVQQNGSPKLSLHLAGYPADPAYVHRIKTFIQENRLDDCVHFLGPVSDNQIMEEYSQADVLVLPSIEESAPVTIEQAMAASTPVIATRVGGIPHLVSDEKTGLLVDPADRAALSQAILRLYGNPQLCKEFGARSYAEARRRFTAESVAHRTYQVYLEAIDQTGSRHHVS